jgi:hypothetical protein
MATPALWKLPAALRTYNVKHIPLNATIASQECFVCYRNFGDKDDHDDPREVACEALELQPCKHVMGSECFKKVIDMGMDTCQLCRTKIIPIDDPVPRWLQYMTSSQWFTYQIEATRGLLPRLGGTGQHFDELCERLFRGDISIWACGTLWCHCMIAPFASLINLSLLMFVVQVALFPFAWIYENPLVELFAYSVGLAFTAVLSAMGIAPTHSRLWNELLVGLSLKVVTLIIGPKGFVLILVAHCFVYAVVAGLLIGYGVGLRSKSGR